MGVYSLKGGEERLKEGGGGGVGGCLVSMLDLILGMIRDFAFVMMFSF